LIRLLALLCLPGLALAASVGPVEREKARLESLREQRTALERQLKESETSRAATADQLRDTEKAISAVGRKLRALGDERAAAKAELAEQEQKLKQLERQTVTRQNQLARLLRYQFRPQEADALSVLLAGGDPNVAARDRYFLALLARAKADLIADLRQDAAETQRLTGVVQQRGEKLAELAQREEGERAALRQRQQERQAVLGKISGQIKAQRREIETLKQNEQRLGNLIASLSKKPARAKPPVKAPPVQSGAVPPAPRIAAEPASMSGAFSRLRGTLTLPVRGAVAGRFGTRREDGQSVWKGLFIRAAEGADVRAVAGGVVVFADWLRGYGNLLIIDHDDDFLSIYGNNQTLLADVGQKVGAGATVATVGASGGQPESGLYFELRHRGQAFDPGRWLGSK
jgi:murein hydrolase activator